MAASNTNYVCDMDTYKALHGPWSTKQVVDFIDAHPNRYQLCNMSRYRLAKVGVYPATKVGDAKLSAHVAINLGS